MIALFGRMPDGTPVDEITLRNGALSCQILTYGGAVRSLMAPDKTDQPVDVVLGFDTLEGYLTQDKYIGALVGRYANRIGGSCFSLNGQEYPLAANDGPNHLHGGRVGFDKQLWTVEAMADNAVTLSLASPDGQEGYPGTLQVQASYTLWEDSLEIAYKARSDQATLCNLTNHSYFNLAGHGSGSVLEQYIQLMASRYTPTDAGSIPLGTVELVEGTPMDLRRPQPIGAHIDDDFQQLVQAGGYDHNWVVDDWDGTLRPIARAWSENTGVSMEVQTTLPGVQLYTANFVAGCPVGKGGAVYENRGAFCLETQYFPDSPSHPNFPSARLDAGEVYQSRTVYRFRKLDG